MKAKAGLGAAFAAAFVVGCALSACSTTYQPVPTARIALVIRHGGAWYVKDGREVPLGPLGGDLESMVAGDGDAVRLARRSRTELSFGVPAYVCGIVAVVVGLTLHRPEEWIVAGAGAATAGTGLGLMGAGFINAVDAINVYNDYSDRAPTTKAP
jgi:hypothetical protein